MDVAVRSVGPGVLNLAILHLFFPVVDGGEDKSEKWEKKVHKEMKKISLRL
jgi:hypothetical protein